MCLSVLKPVNRNELQAALTHGALRLREKKENQPLKQLRQNFSQPVNPRIGLPAGNCIEYADVGKIVRCQGEGNYTYIWFESNKHLLVSKTLVEFEELLQEYNFVRVHKSNLVNLNHIVAYIKTDSML